VCVVILEIISQVHEEVLRLLLAALPKLDTPQLAHYLQETLKHSRKSRKCAALSNIR
jgi:hypothetical protein